MRVQLDWQASDESGNWEMIAQVGGHSRLHLAWRVWACLLGTALVLTVGTAAYLHQRYERLRRHIAFQVQSVVDLEGQALRNGDLARFLAQQDPAAPGWYGQQALYASGRDPLAGVGANLWPAQVQEVNLRGDMAWVEVLTDGGRVRQARFYRQVGPSWLHTAPQPAFWGDPVGHQAERVTLHGHRRDLPHTQPLVDYIKAVIGDLCTDFDCPPHYVLQVELVPDPTAPYLRDHALVLASPWLWGIPADGAWDPTYLAGVRYWTAYDVASRALCSDVGPGQPRVAPLSPLGRAIVAEYAALYAQGDLAPAPILRRVIERHGDGYLPEVLQAAAQASSLSSFLEEWLALSPSGPEGALFETLLHIESEALYAGQRDTYLLLQDDDARRQQLQGALYDWFQAAVPPCADPTIEVQQAVVVDGEAWVWLSKQRICGNRRQDLAASWVAHFHLQGGDWKRTLLDPPSQDDPGNS